MVGRQRFKPVASRMTRLSLLNKDRKLCDFFPAQWVRWGSKRRWQVRTGSKGSFEKLRLNTRYRSSVLVFTLLRTWTLAHWNPTGRQNRPETSTSGCQWPSECSKWTNGAPATNQPIPPRPNEKTTVPPTNTFVSILGSHFENPNWPPQETPRTVRHSLGNVTGIIASISAIGPGPWSVHCLPTNRTWVEVPTRGAVCVRCARWVLKPKA